MALRYRIVPVPELDPVCVEQMYTLMQQSYCHVDRLAFDRDLAGKTWVILLEAEENGALRGFSTQQCYDAMQEDQPCRIVFSGDTIIAPSHWGSLKLPLAFGGLMLSLVDQNPSSPLYWFLITKGHRTYRYLPVFFKSFHPHHRIPTPPGLQRFMHELAQARFGEAYDPDRGIVVARESSQCLQPHLAHIEPQRIQRDPHTRYFLERNPHYAQGNELVCLAEFSRSNLRPYILRELERACPVSV